MGSLRLVGRGGTTLLYSQTRHLVIVCRKLATRRMPACASSFSECLNGAQIRRQVWRSFPDSSRMLSSECGDVRLGDCDARLIFQSAVDAVHPDTMVKRALKRVGDQLTVGGRGYKLKRNVQVVAFGKAVAGMVRAAQDVLQEHITGGVASIPTGSQTLAQLHTRELLPAGGAVELMEGAANNIPDADAERAARRIRDLVSGLDEEEIVLTLISGGGSALLPAPIPPITMEDMAHVTEMLGRGGATIQQLNTVRKHIEQLKGGGLATAAYPAQMISLILSDVIGDDLDFIASGPTVPNTSPVRDCLQLIETLGVEAEVPPRVLALLRDKAAQPPEDHIVSHYEHVNNVLVGTNTVALQAASRHASSLGYVPYLLSNTFSGDAQDLAILFANLAEYIVLLLTGEAATDVRTYHKCKENLEGMFRSHGLSCSQLVDLTKLSQESQTTRQPICVLGGGETTVNVRGSGQGGRNQEMALEAAVSMHESAHLAECSEWEVHFLSAGSDGQDGPTDAAGASVQPALVATAVEQHLQPLTFLNDNNSYSFFKQFNQGKGHVMTGLTGTNVMDIQLLLIKPNNVIYPDITNT